MRKFPGELKRGGGGNHRQVMLDEEQKKWLVRWFPVTENRKLAKAMGLSIGCMRGLAAGLGAFKSEEGLAAIRKRQGQAMARTFERRGLYDAKRGHPCSEATQNGAKRRWEMIRRGEMKTPRAILKEKDPDGYAKMMTRLSESRKELFRKEKLRVKYGLERQTRLSGVVLYPFTRSQIHHRHNALVRGYLLDVDCTEGSGGRYVIFYDDKTQRSEKFEQNCVKDGFTIMKSG